MQIFKNILVPTDFSRPADFAVVYAANLAHFTGAGITLYHSFIPFESAFYPETQGIKENIEAEEQLRFRLSHMHDLLKKTHKKLKITTFVDRGAFLPKVKDYCKKNHPDLIVMGTKGASGLREVMLGSFTADLIQDAPCPVIAIPARWQFKKLEKMALAVNYKPQDLYALQHLLKLNEGFGAEISILHVHLAGQTAADSTAGSISQKDFEQKAAGTALKFKTIRSEDVLDALIETAAHDKTDILVISPRKREKIWERLFSRNLAKTAICHITIPIMAIPPMAAETAHKQE